MKTQVYASTYDRLRGEPTWRLLSANTATDVLALLRQLLFDNDRVLPGAVLVERLTTELAIQRANGRDLGGTAAYYLRDWVASGWLERRYLAGADDEEYELTVPALQALRFVESLQTQRTVATESRLALVMDQLAQLSRQTDADPITRLEQLYEERRRLDAEIDRVASGDVPVLSPERAAERLKEVIALARELSEDFRQVRDEFDSLSRGFRQRVVEEEASRGQVLADLFAGVDLIADSPAGRTFTAFWSLLIDPEQSAQLEASIDAVASREFAQTVTRDERMFLSTLTRTLLERAGSVNDTQTGFARSLRSFVQQREFSEQRRLTKLLQLAKADALQLREQMRPEQQTGLQLRLSSGTYRSVSQWKLHEPVEPIVAGELVVAPKAEITAAEVRGMVERSEVNFRALRANVREALKDHSQISIGKLLQRYPADQGLGTVVGYISLGSKHGVQTEGLTERVTWTTGAGKPRAAHIPMIHFLAERLEELHD